VTRRPIALLVKRFPKLSETFILHEVLALEALGWPVTLFTLHPPTDELTHADVARVAAKIIQLPTRSPEEVLARECRVRGIAHIHAHFADYPADIARDAAASAGLGFSISAHAKDIYLADPATARRSLRAARFVTTCTSYNAEYLRRLAPGVPVAKLYHGIDCDKFACTGHARQDPPLILSVGRLRTKKGFDTLIRACAVLHGEGRAFACEILGYGPELANLRQLIASLGLARHITLRGKQPHEEIVRRIGAASLFALPCRIDADGDRDGIPNVILEAMAARLPVVSTQVSGVPEVITDGHTGLLVAPDDPQALACAMARLIDDRALAQRLADNAHAAVTDRFGSGRDMAALDRMLLTATGEGPGSIGYFIKGFPRLSESFIANEVLLLEQLGKYVTVFAGARGDDLAAPVLARLQAPLAYLPAAGSVSRNSLWQWLRIVVPAYGLSHLRLIRRAPRQWWNGLVHAVRLARQYRHADGRKFKRSYLKQFAQAGAVAEALERAGVTHLHGHFCHSATTISWLAADMADVPFSFTAHAKDIYQVRHNPGDLLGRKVAAARFVTTCTAANHDHMSERVDDADKLHTVYHGLDTAFFHPVPRAVDGPARILAVGRHVEKKGFDLLLAALAELRRRGVDFRFRLIGEEGPATFELARQLALNDLADCCTIAPPEPREQLRASYHAADIFVLPCRIDDSGDRDGIPNVLAEAMATGLAVLSTNVSGIPEIVDDGVNGLLVAPDNVRELADALEMLCRDPALRGKLGAAATRQIAEVFDADRTILDLSALFDGCLHREAAE
jgi:glycosyltransferase involved in cell wall biosynthesis